MPSRVYYNENDPFVVQWLRNLIVAGHIPAGDVDDRSIVDVRPSDLAGYTQHHFFAGIAGWSLALKLAGWPEDRPVWTGSCPCQPFSAAGKQEGFADERHLWPHWSRLISECRPSIIFGEQVSSAIRHGWLDLVFSDLEREDYACGAAVLPACGAGAPHIRQRLWWVAKSDGGHEPQERAGDGAECEQRAQIRRGAVIAAGIGAASRNGGVAHDDERGCTVEQATWLHDQRASRHDVTRCGAGELANAGCGSGQSDRFDMAGAPPAHRDYRHANANEQPSCSPWSDLIWLPCTDGKARPTKPGIFPLAHGVPARVGKLRAAGNAIVPQAAAEFIVACM